MYITSPTGSNEVGCSSELHIVGFHSTHSPVLGLNAYPSGHPVSPPG